LRVTSRSASHALIDWPSTRGKGLLSPAQVVHLIAPLCDAVDYLHRRGVVHGNISPNYIFIEGTPQAPVARLLESGLALLRVGGLALPPVPSVMVSTDHLAPERIKGARATSSSDLYALGCVMYELLTGAPPFRRRDPESTRRAHLEAAMPALPGEATILWPVLARCLEKEPGLRFADALQLKEAMLDALAPRQCNGRDHLPLERQPIPFHTTDESFPRPPLEFTERLPLANPKL
jgi:serine/threonine-protein kinase